MNNRCSRIIGVIVLFLTCTAFTTLEDEKIDAGRIGTPGEPLVEQIIEIANEVAQLTTTLKDENRATFPEGFNLPMLLEKLTTARVYTNERVYLQNAVGSEPFEVDALNFPEENKIIFGKLRVEQMLSNLKAVRTLVLHEFMGLARIDDSSYEYSTFIARNIMTGGKNGELWLLKDIVAPGFQNPFTNASLEFSAQVLEESEGTSKYFQNKRLVSYETLDETLPYCMISLNSVEDGSYPKSTKGVISMATPSEDEFGNAVRLAISIPQVDKIECSSGGSAMVTLEDMLNSFGNYVTFSHEGSAPLGNVLCL